MEPMETAQRLDGGSFGVGGVPFRGKLKAPEMDEQRVSRLGLNKGSISYKHCGIVH